MNPLKFGDGPLVWIDLETTGLDPVDNRIIEIAILITNGNLDLVDEDGCHYIVKSDDRILKEMDAWCLEQHTKSGLITQAFSSPHTANEAASAALEYITRWVPEPRSGLIAGSSVHFDAMFLRAKGPDAIENGGERIWNKIQEHLHYRIVDVSTIKELCRRWYPDVTKRYQEISPRRSNHRALDDIRASIAELKFYRDNVFIKQNTGSQTPSSNS
ncbi:ribonuclease H-like protein [Ceratobasidium sp. AG-I]|nr:ribonuclease H-like protein [Ceratobasidium sp. AG-I]